METTSRTRTSPLAVNTNVSSTAFYDRIQNNRGLAIQLGVGIVALAIVVGAVWGIWSYRSTEASSALAAAMATYDTPVNTPEQPVAPSVKSFASLEDRAKAANAGFAAVANKYGMTTAGRNAQYLEGVTAMQSGQNGTAETILKKSADDWNHDIATLAQMSLAGLYRSTGREPLAIETYQKVANKPSTLVPAGMAQLQLAELYEADGKTAEARKIYAQIKDKDPKSASAELASQKLNGPAAQ